MLIKRLLTALVLIPLVLGGIFFTSTFIFGIACALVLMLALVEWLVIAQQSKKRIAGYFAFYLFLLVLGFLWPNQFSVFLLSALLWLTLLGLVWFYPKYTPHLLKQVDCQAILGVLLIYLAWYGLYGLRLLENGTTWVVILLLLNWGSDTFAYFAGKKYGKTALAPNVSPNKTFEGLFTGLLATSALLMLWYGFSFFMEWYEIPIGLNKINAWVVFFLFMTTILVGVLGDLFESLIKRLSQVKDSGHLLPGHGGMLDRLDSLIASAPFFSLCLLWMGAK